MSGVTYGLLSGAAPALQPRSTYGSASSGLAGRRGTASALQPLPSGTLFRHLGLHEVSEEVPPQHIFQVGGVWVLGSHPHPLTQF